MSENKSGDKSERKSSGTPESASDELKTLWKTQDQKNADSLGRFVRDRLLQDLGRRRRRENFQLAHALAGATALVTLVSWVLATRPPRGLPLTLALLALLVPPLGLLVARVATWRAGRRIAAGRGASLVEATQGSLAAVDQDLRTTRSVLLAQVATALLLPLVFWLFWRAGLVRPRDVLAQAGLFYSALGAVALVLLHRRRSLLLPRRGELRALLESTRPPAVADSAG